MKDSQQTEGQSLLWRIDGWFPDLSPDTRAKLKFFWDQLQRLNRNYNLVPAKTLAVADALHFADSIYGCQLVIKEVPQGKTIYDMFGGDGFPGLVLALLGPKHRVVLVEADGKKCEFLKLVASGMDLKNVEVRNQTVESLGADSVEYGVVRGFGNISKTILFFRRMFSANGELYHFKSEEWGIEVAEIPSQLCAVWFPALVGEYKLPVGGIKFSVVKTTKNQR